MFDRVWQWFQSSGLTHVMIAIPGAEAMTLLVLLTICLLLRLNRTGLIAAYIFTYRWGLLFGKQYFALDARLYNIFLTSYIIFGIMVLTLVLVAIMFSSSSSDAEQDGRQ